VALGLIGGMAGFVLHGLLDNSYFLPDLAVLFWICLATLSLVGAERGEQTGLAPERLAPRSPTEEVVA
jgi:hypothetical protein